MKTTLIAGDQLTDDHVKTWIELLRADASLASPYLRPEFTQAVAAIRADVEVAIAEDQGETVGFFPFQRSRRNVGRPVGGRLSDCQAFIVRGGVDWSAEELISACGLTSWNFSYLLASQTPFRDYHYTTEDTVYTDLMNGYDAYIAENNRGNSKTFKDLRRRARKLERTLGPLRVDLYSTDEHVFQTLLDWKSKQYQRTNAADIFSFPWTVALLRYILPQRSEGFSGMMSALYAGDTLAAIHLGMRSHDVLHGWFPTYDRDLRQYSPGLLLWLEIAKLGAADGIRRIDFGKTDEPYKLKLASGAVPVGEGTVDLRPLSRAIRTTWRHTYDWLRESPLRRPLRAPAAAAYRLREWMAFH